MFSALFFTTLAGQPLSRFIEEETGPDRLRHLPKSRSIWRSWRLNICSEPPRHISTGKVGKGPHYRATMVRGETEAAGLSAPLICRLPALPGPWRAAFLCGSNRYYARQLVRRGGGGEQWENSGKREKTLLCVLIAFPEFSSRRAGS